MNLLQMRTKVRMLTRETDSADTNLSDTEINDEINNTTPLLAADTEELVNFADYTTAVDTERYSLPLNYLKVKACVLHIDSNWRELQFFATIKQYHALQYQMVSNTGIPVAYKIELGATSTAANSPPGDLWLTPTPDNNGGANYVVRLYYFQMPTTLSADTDVTELPILTHDAICYKAAADLSLKLDEQGRSAFFIGKFESEVRKIKDYYAELQRDRLPMVKDVMGYAQYEWGESDGSLAGLKGLTGGGS